MTYGMCPTCGQTYHMSVGDVEAWYRERYPHLPVSSLVPGACFFCWPQLSKGDGVVIRKSVVARSEAQVGEFGVIESILSSDDGSLFLAKLDSGKEYYFIRSELRKLRDGESKPARIIAE